MLFIVKSTCISRSMSLWLRSSTYILRLPCQIIAEFKVKRTDSILTGIAPLTKKEAIDEAICQSECVFHNKCKSLAISNEGTCLLYAKSHEDIRDNVEISYERGYTYFSTLFNESQVRIEKDTKSRSRVKFNDSYV